MLKSGLRFLYLIILTTSDSATNVFERFKILAQGDFQSRNVEAIITDD